MTKSILIVTPYYVPYIVGGAEISTQLIAENVPGVDILTIGYSDGERRYGNARILEVQVSALESAWEKMLQGSALNFKEKIKLNLYPQFPKKRLVQRYIELFDQYDIVAVNSNCELLDRASIWKAASLSKAEFVVILRDYTLLNKHILGYDLSSLLKAMVKKELGNINRLVSPSKYMLSLHYDEYPELAEIPSQVIPNAVDIAFREPKRNKQKQIIYAGSLTTDKGIETLLKAVRGFGDVISDDLLTMYGKGPLADECKKTPGVKVHDWIPRKQLYNEIEDSKLLVLPSEWPEAFGRVLVEAVACGTIPLGSDAGAIPEVLDYDDDLIFTAGDAADLEEKARGILRWDWDTYTNKLAILRRRMSKYTLSSYKDEWENFFNASS